MSTVATSIDVVQTVGQLETMLKQIETYLNEFDANTPLVNFDEQQKMLTVSCYKLHLKLFRLSTRTCTWPSGSASS